METESMNGEGKPNKFHKSVKTFDQTFMFCIILASVNLKFSNCSGFKININIESCFVNISNIIWSKTNIRFMFNQSLPIFSNKKPQPSKSFFNFICKKKPLNSFFGAISNFVSNLNDLHYYFLLDATWENQLSRPEIRGSRPNHQNVKLMGDFYSAIRSRDSFFLFEFISKLLFIWIWFKHEWGTL